MGSANWTAANRTRTRTNETERNARRRHAGAPERKDGAIHVCPLSAVPDTVARSKASHLLTWLQDEIVVETPRLILPERHIRFHIHDISEPLLGYVAPGREHIDQLIEFALDWGGRGPDRRALLGRHQPLHRRRLHGAVRHQSRRPPRS